MKNLYVINLQKDGRSIANQFLIYYVENDKQYKIFQSYQSMILKYENHTLVEVGADWNYSKTTGKYRNIITYMDKKAFEKMLEKEFEWNNETQTYIRKK